MKTHLKLILSAVSMLCLFQFGFSQSDVAGPTGHLRVPGYYVGWTPGLGSTPGDLQIRNNFNQPINFFTNNFQRITIMGGNGTTGGFVGISPNAAGFTPQNLLHLNDGINSYLQVTTTGIGNGPLNGLKIGMLSTSTNAIIANQESSRLLFATGGAFIGNTKMCILNNGNVGIGSGFITPGNKLDVNGGDIDVDQTAFGYMIGNLHVMKRNSGIGDGIYVGVGAGSGPQCTFLGYNSGNVNGGNKNTFIGYLAGVVNDLGDANVFVGGQSGTSNDFGAGNLFAGVESGTKNVNGNGNTILGFKADMAGPNQTILSNAAAIGSNAIVTSNNKMILGDNRVWVGIGLTSDPTPFFGPGNSLEINARDNITSAIIPNASGLRFRQLTSVSPSITNPGAGVLALSASGDVIYVNSPTGGLGNYCTGAANPLTGDYQIPLGGFHFNYNGDGFVNIGALAGCNATVARLFVRNTAPSTPTLNGIFSECNNGAGSHAVQGQTATGVGYAGYFNGDVYTTSAQYYTSDGALKNNFDSINNAISLIRDLKPYTFYFDTNNVYGFNFSSKQQYGFKAEDVKVILPTLVKNIDKPVKFDSAGNVIPTPAAEFCGINYTSLIPILTAGMQAQQLSIDSLRNSSPFGVCGTNPTILSNSAEVDLSGNNFRFTNGKVGLNTSCTPSHRLHVIGTSPASSSVFPFGTVCAKFDQGASGSAVNVGAWAVASSASGGGYRANLAGLFDANSDATENYGITTTAAGAGVNYGIYAYVPLTPGNYAGYFDGDVFINSPTYGTAQVINPSDAMFKNTIQPISNAAGTIGQLQPHSFYFDTANAYGLRFSGKKQYGLIAQEVETVLPELVSNQTKPARYDSLGNIVTAAVTYKGLNYNAFIGLLIKSNQEQQARLDHQDSVINQLVASVNSCCNENSKTTGNNSTTSNAINVELSDADAIVLNQNVPNPFAEQTTISYNIPKNTSAAQILFYDISGRQIKSVDITKKGKGQLNVFANDLSNGIYSYTLIVDGKIFETKKMVKQQ